MKEKNTHNLLPCPFCGMEQSDFSIIVEQQNEGVVAFVLCDCEARTGRGQRTGNVIEAIEKACKRWNERSVPLCSS